MEMSKPTFVVGNVGLKMIGGLAEIPTADLYIDARALPDAAHMRPKKIGADLKLTYMEQEAPRAIEGILDYVDESIRNIQTRRRDHADPFKEPFRIITFCAFGMNRSVALREAIVRHLRGRGFNVADAGVVKDAPSHQQLQPAPSNE